MDYSDCLDQTGCGELLRMNKMMLPAGTLVPPTVTYTRTPIRIRSLFGCARFAYGGGKGFCSKCYGTDGQTGLTEVDSPVGQRAARHLLTALRLIRDTSAIAALVEPPSLDTGAVISPSDGVVRVGRTRTGWTRLVVRSAQGYEQVFLTRLHPTVKSRNRVWVGQALTTGAPSLDILLQTFGDRFVSNYLLTELLTRMMNRGVRIPERDIEMLVTLLLSRVVIEHAGENEDRWLEGTNVPMSWFVAFNEKRIRDGRPILGRQPVTGLTELFELRSLDRQLNALP